MQVGITLKLQKETPLYMKNHIMQEIRPNITKKIESCASYYY